LQQTASRRTTRPRRRLLRGFKFCGLSFTAHRVLLLLLLLLLSCALRKCADVNWRLPSCLWRFREKSDFKMSVTSNLCSCLLCMRVDIIVICWVLLPQICYKLNTVADCDQCRAVDAVRQDLMRELNSLQDSYLVRRYRPLAALLTSHVSKGRTAFIFRGEGAHTFAKEKSRRSNLCAGASGWSRGHSAVFTGVTRLLRMAAQGITRGWVCC